MKTICNAMWPLKMLKMLKMPLNYEFCFIVDKPQHPTSKFMVPFS